ncbi:MAG: GDP-L-fucose synthase family protein [Bacillota bacterium]
MNRDSKIFIAGHTNMIGCSFLSYLKNNGYKKIIAKTPAELDLTDQLRVKEFFFSTRPDYVILAAGKSGGIQANITYPGDYIYNNLQIESNVIHFAWKSGVKKLLFLGSACMYPRICPQPMKEDYLLTGRPEPTSECYAVAKIAGIKLCQAYNMQYGTCFIPVVPASIYGPHDDFDPGSGHVLAALLRKIHEAKVNNEKGVAVWGTGSPRREFLYVDDLVEACILLLNHCNEPELINIGFGRDISIKELAHLIKGIAGYGGDICFDETKPDGAARKLLDVAKIRGMGWKPGVRLEEGIKRTYEWYLKHQ